jgi:hypothetical protein
MLEIVHQVEEILESLDEAEETPFDLDAEDDAILDIVLKPISPIEFKAENPTLETGDHVKYTDPAGNTFEAPIVPPCAGHDAETEKELISDFSLPEEDEDLSQRAADLEMMEAVEQSEGIEVVANLDNVPVEKKEEIIDDSFDLDLDKFDPRDKSWEEIKAHTGDDDWSEIDEDIMEDFTIQKNKISEMFNRMNRYN